MIFSTHRALFRLRPKWVPWDGTFCEGNMVIDPESMGEPTDEHEDSLPIWVAECDKCGLEIGIPPRQQKAWREDAVRTGV